jgi:hypothetical protein
MQVTNFVLGENVISSVVDQGTSVDTLCLENKRLPFAYLDIIKTKITGAICSKAALHTVAKISNGLHPERLPGVEICRLL